MLYASATDFAIVVANRNGTLRLVERESRFGGTFVALQDSNGVIEVQPDMASAERRVAECAA